jgi:transcriptional regulator with XRE-family HTH domain
MVTEILAARSIRLEGLRHQRHEVLLSKRAKVTNVYLSQLENGRKKSPSLAVLRRLAKALGVPMTELLE